MRACLLSSLVIGTLLFAAAGRAAPERYAYAYGEGGALSQFRVTPDGQLTPLNPPTVKFGQGVSCYHLAVAASRRAVYVMVGNGDAEALYQFHISSQGALTPLTPASLPLDREAEEMVVGTGDKDLYVVADVAKPRNVFDGTVTQFRIAPDGRLSPAGQPLRTGRQMVGFVAEDDTHFLSVNGITGMLSRFVVGADGSLTLLPALPILPPDSPRSLEGVYADSRNGVVYVTTMSFDPITNDLRTFHIGADDTLTPLGDPLPLVNMASVIFSHDGRAAYVTSVPPPAHTDATGAPDNVSQFRVAADGALIPMKPFTVKFYDGYSLSLTADDRYAYATASQPWAVSQAAITGDGFLTPLTPVQVNVRLDNDRIRGLAGPFLAGPSLFVISLSVIPLNSPAPPNRIAQFRIGPDGRLTQLPGLLPCGQADRMAFVTVPGTTSQ